MATKYLISNPTGTAKICQALQVAFDTNVSWLEKSYGEAFRHTTGTEQSPVYLPAIYTDAAQLKELIPDNFDGNSIFFYPDSPQGYKLTGGTQYGQIQMNAIVFADLRKVRPLITTYRPLSEMKSDLLSVLLNLNSSVAQLDSDTQINVYDRFEQVFTDFSYREMSQQPNAEHFAVVRLSFSIFAKGINC